MRSIAKLKVANKRKKADRTVGAMLNETRRLLNDFYEPYNQELADILDDDKFLWEPEENDYNSLEDKWILNPKLYYNVSFCDIWYFMCMRRDWCMLIGVWVCKYMFFSVMEC